IATPVGEALIMTGLGLAVAIPAVLAYNGFVRGNRVYLARLDAFAHDLFTFLSTGQQAVESSGKVRHVTLAASKREKIMAFGSFDNSKGSTRTMAEINLVPLIDVMLVLLVIFIITAPLLSHSIKINVPQASAQPVQQEPVVIDLAVDAQGQLYWNEEAVDIDQLT